MIARLHGRLVERGGERVVVDCNGVGYEVSVSAVTAAVLPAVGEEVTLRVFTHAIESRIALFGFATAEERALFDLLITVKNVGPTTAVGILSGGATPAALAGAVAAGDRAGLTAVKGIGKKTAELIIAELRDKCELLLASWGAAGGPVARPVPAPERRSRPTDPRLVTVGSALVNLGWRQAEADKALAQLELDDTTTPEALLRQALRIMPR